MINEQPIVRDSADLEPGVIALANESRFNAGTFSEGLTEYTVGFEDSENIQETLDYIAPAVPVGPRFEYKTGKDSKYFIAEINDKRAIGAEFKRLETSGETQTARTHNRGLTYRIDRDDDLLAEEQVVKMLQTAIFRGKLRRAFTVLLAIDAGAGSVWDASSQPDELMRAQVAASQLASGVFPNRGVVGLPAWNYRAAAYAPQENAGATAGYGMSPEMVANGLGLDSMKLSRELFQVSGTAKNRILSSNVLFFNGHDGLMKDDPSNVKQFFTPVDGGGRFAVHRQEVGVKFIDITVEHNDLIVSTSTKGVKRMNVTNS